MHHGKTESSSYDLNLFSLHTQATAASVFSGQSFQNRAVPQPSVTSYRGAVKAADSSDSDPDSDEEAAMWRHKRQKVSDAPPPPPPAPTASHRGHAESRGVLGAPGGRKVNNIWGSVVQEQTQEAVAAELGIFGMEGDVSMSQRSMETYNYVLARKMMEKEREEEELAKNQGEVSMLDDQLDEYMRGRGSAENGDGHSKRKRTVKERLGPRAEMDVKGRYEITEDDPEDRVIDEIAYRYSD